MLILYYLPLRSSSFQYQDLPIQVQVLSRIGCKIILTASINPIRVDQPLGCVLGEGMISENYQTQKSTRITTFPINTSFNLLLVIFVRLILTLL